MGQNLLRGLGGMLLRENFEDLRLYSKGSLILTLQLNSSEMPSSAIEV
jgi:hypothetical protein